MVMVNGIDSDIDGDGVDNDEDIFPRDSNESLDTDHDGTGDNADTDDDNDGISDIDEMAYGLNPLDPSDATLDSDGDGVSNVDEIDAGTDPSVNEATLNIKPIDDIYTFVNANIQSMEIEANASNGSALGYAVTSSNEDVVMATLDTHMLTLTLVANAQGESNITVTVSLGELQSSETFKVKVKKAQISEENSNGEYEAVEDENYNAEVGDAQVTVDVGEDGTLDHRVTIGTQETHLHVDIAGAEVQIGQNHEVRITLPTQEELSFMITVDGRVKPFVFGALLPVEALPLGTQIEADSHKVRFTIPLGERLEF